MTTNWTRHVMLDTDEDLREELNLYAGQEHQDLATALAERQAARDAADRLDPDHERWTECHCLTCQPTNTERTQPIRKVG